MDKYCYHGLLWFGQGEDVKIFDADSGEELLEHTLSERVDEIELPEYTPYVYLEYIEVGDTSGPYIDTGIPMNTLNGCEVKFKYNGNNADNRALFGTYLPYYDSLIENYQGYIGWRIGNVGFSQLTATKIPLDTNVHVAKADTSDILMDSINGGVPDWSRVPSDQNVYIFNEGGNRHSPTNNARIYYVKMYKNNVLSYHLIPAKRKSDNAIGMHDIINDIFYSNSGSGSFIAGPNKQS